MSQFFLALLSVLLAIPLVIISIPYLNTLLQIEIPVFFINSGDTWVIIFSLVVVTGLFAGLYPAFYLTAYKAISTLKGNLSNNLASGVIRKALVVIQFVISIALVVSVIGYYQKSSLHW